MPAVIRFALLFFTLTANIFAQSDSPKTAGSGHSLPDMQKQIRLDLRCFTIVADALRRYEKGIRFTLGPNYNDFGLSPVPPDKPASLNGIQLISSKRVTETHIPVFLHVLKNEELRSFIMTAQENERSNVRFAPTLKIPDGRTLEVRDSASEGTIEIHPVGGGMSPQLRPNEDGWRIMVRGDIRADRRIGMHLRLTQNQQVDLKTSNTAQERPMPASNQTKSVQTELAVELEPNTPAAVWGMPVPDFEIPKRSRSLLQVAASKTDDIEMMMLIILTPSLENAPLNGADTKVKKFSYSPVAD